MTAPAAGRFWVDAWDPAYAAAADGDGGPDQRSTAQLDLAVEVPAAQWAPIPCPVDLVAPDTVRMVDGVRRIDARVWTVEPDGRSYPGLAASYAAGVVCCDLSRGVASVSHTIVERALFTASPGAAAIACGQIRYRVRQVDAHEPAELLSAVQGPLTELEAQVATAARAQADPEPTDDLLVLDGPLRGRSHLPRTIGFIKTHRRQYLPSEQAMAVTALAPGQRSPVFRLGTNWHRYTWYLRLPGGSGGPWSGLARAECDIELPKSAAVALADLSVVTLPRFAATAYKDARAPQNLVPIAGLEHRLRAQLGHPALLHRALTRAAATTADA